ncbi:hypothetical protein AVEN_180207-1, partial [Araneus ventricosus]
LAGRNCRHQNSRRQEAKDSLGRAQMSPIRTAKSQEDSLAGEQNAVNCEQPSRQEAKRFSVTAKCRQCRKPVAMKRFSQLGRKASHQELSPRKKRSADFPLRSQMSLIVNSQVAKKRSDFVSGVICHQRQPVAKKPGFQLAGRNTPIVNRSLQRFSVSRAQMSPIVNQTRAKSPREWL